MQFLPLNFFFPDFLSSKFIMLAKRGALIVFEGCDKAGKSTHSKLLVSTLEKNEIPCLLMNFPSKNQVYSLPSQFEDSVLSLNAFDFL